MIVLAGGVVIGIIFFLGFAVVFLVHGIGLPDEKAEAVKAWLKTQPDHIKEEYALHEKRKAEYIRRWDKVVKIWGKLQQERYDKGLPEDWYGTRNAACSQMGVLKGWEDVIFTRDTKDLPCGKRTWAEDCPNMLSRKPEPSLNKWRENPGIQAPRGWG